MIHHANQVAFVVVGWIEGPYALRWRLQSGAGGGETQLELLLHVLVGGRGGAEDPIVASLLWWTHSFATDGTQPRLVILSYPSLHDSNKWSRIAEKSWKGFPLTARSKALVPEIPAVAYKQSTLNVSSTMT